MSIFRRNCRPSGFLTLPQSYSSRSTEDPIGSSSVSSFKLTSSGPRGVIHFITVTLDPVVRSGTPGTTFTITYPPTTSPRDPVCPCRHDTTYKRISGKHTILPGPRTFPIQCLRRSPERWSDTTYYRGNEVLNTVLRKLRQ